MLNAEQVLGIYENVSVLTRQMLAAAQASDWDQLSELESRCAHEVGLLRSEGQLPVASLSAELRERKVQMLRQILDDDRAIRDLTQPWLQRLQGLIHNTGQQRKLEQAYGGF
ncbi:flagellar protein FliT [Malikia granosa]|uniref:Flagellar protein FliT n=1 Tax=Malikia granosa TaxID=263067 RepID=A0A2S9K4H9_9BURK|nr:flagellar protein FliT [Malikia granosa]PRD65297.1 flagellar protein FliT [Malikia granosa]